MKSDVQIQKDVIAQLGWEPEVDAAEIGVSVKNGVVTLTGIVNTYGKKIAAENAAKRVAGVTAIAEEIQVGVSPAFRRTDTEIAEEILNVLKWHAAVDESKIKARVEDGIVTLEGQVDWDYQRKSAKSAIENLAGVRMINSFITVKPVTAPADIKRRISDAFRRSAAIDADKVFVEIIGNKAVLRGKVHSLKEKEDASVATWAAPGVTEVDNHLEITKAEFAF